NYGDKRAFDSVVQAASGLMHLTGYPDHLPVKVGISASDISAGVALVAAVLGALRRRHLIEQGAHIDLAMADIGMWMTQGCWPEVFYGSGDPTRMGNRSALACPHDIFATQGGYVAIAVETDAQWKTLVTLIGNQDFQTDEKLQTASGRMQHLEHVE